MEGRGMTYRELLEFVSWHFQSGRTADNRTVLECREHGECRVEVPE